MTTRPPTLTVIIPTYNWSSVLPYSIGSALGQTFADFELLVVGDGCTDDSGAVVDSIGDPRVRWINLPANSGHQSQPNNEGLRQARGALIAYLGHDDLWLPHHLASMVGAIDAGVDVAFGVTQLVGPGGRTEAAVLRSEYKPGMWLPPSSVVHRRSVVDHVGGWRDHRELGVDPEVDMWRRAFEAGQRFAFVPRLSAIKFPAAMRRNVYRDRPSHEQAAWLERIRREADFEAVQLAALLAASREPRMLYTEPYGDMLHDFLRDSIRTLRPRLFRKLRSFPGIRKGARVDRRRQFKGLDRIP